jgi:Fe(3+) dicitrate transport protein
MIARSAFLLLLTIFTCNLYAQDPSFKPAVDSPAKTIYLKEVTVVGRNTINDIHQLPEIVGTEIFAGKKNSLVVIDNLNANVVTNTMRQVVAKVPGMHIWESDGSGIQIGIATRGLSPNRSWEFNVRQNGYDISADPFGYPEAYYTPQLQAVQRIQIVRGAGSLQYGPQFGGMVNFILRDGSEIKKKFEFETNNTAGSYGLLNTYNSIGGQTNRFNYYAFYDHRNANGWRENSKYHVNTGFATMHYKITEKFTLGAEYMRWNMQSQQPGGLTDKEFNTDPKKSYRSRNWFNITWHTAAVSAVYNFKDNNRINLKLFTITGDRNSVGYLQPIDIKDTVNALTGMYNNRTADRDKYKNFGAEARYLADYKLLGLKNTLSAGGRFFNGKTDRFKNGKAGTGSDYDMSITGIFPSDIDMNTKNASAFAENIFRLTDRFIIIPGVRYEYITTSVKGRQGINATGEALNLSDQEKRRNFILYGIGTEYHLPNGTEFYGNYTRAYRPMLFSDLTASPTTDVIDPFLRDAKGYSSDIGYRGKIKNFLFFDAGIFYMKYNNRIGTITQFRPDLTTYSYRTNVANSNSTGVETLVEFNPVKAWLPQKKWSVNLYTSFSYTRARYDRFKVVKKTGNILVETSLAGNSVENAPEEIIRSGFTFFYKGLSLNLQYSYSGKSFSDANNTVASSSNGQTGIIPAYGVTDIAGTYRIKYFNFRAGINNLANHSYFTRRAGGYPGPGILPSDGRNYFISAGLKL